MLILAVECSEPRASIALLKDGRVIASAQSEPRRAHGGRLLVEIDALLKANHCDVSDIDVFAASAGPGSFTGVRVGLATIRSLAWSNQRACTALSTLDVLAHSVTTTGQWLSPVVDARKQEVYAALYSKREGKLQQILAPQAVAPAEWLVRVEEYTQESVHYVGSGTVRYPEQFASEMEQPMDVAPEATALAGLVFERMTTDGVAGLPPAIPCYIRASEAEVKFGKAPALDIETQISAYDRSNR